MKPKFVTKMAANPKILFVLSLVRLINGC